jgi:hypothetical protein
MNGRSQAAKRKARGCARFETMRTVLLLIARTRNAHVLMCMPDEPFTHFVFKSDAFKAQPLSCRKLDRRRSYAFMLYDVRQHKNSDEYRFAFLVWVQRIYFWHLNTFFRKYYWCKR